MKTIEEIRYDNVRGLIRNRFEGNAAQFSKAIGKEPGQTNQFAGPRPTKTIGSTIAREIEKMLGLERGLLDHEIGIRIPRTNAIASMGYGEADSTSAEVTEYVEISADWPSLRRIAITSPNNLALIEGRGNSMEGIFNHGDLLIVDRGVKDVTIDAIYVFRFETKTYIKILQRIPGNAIQAISNNQSYKPFVINESNSEGFEILGRVVWVWTGRAI